VHQGGKGEEVMTLICPKCHDRFLKQPRYDKHVAKCPGKRCKNCGAIGHLACGISVSGEEMKRRMQELAKKGPVRIVVIP